MKGLWTILIFSILVTSLTAQEKYDQYKNYALVRVSVNNTDLDLIETTEYLIDTLSKEKIKMNFKTPFNHHEFRYGFVYAHTGSIEGLMKLDGTILLDQARHITFYEKDSILIAHRPMTEGWLLMNFKGDTLYFEPRGASHNVPKITGEIFPVVSYNDTLNRIWGYLDKKGKWIISPQFNNALPFESGIARVELNGKWGAINEKGEFIVQPQYETHDF